MDWEINTHNFDGPRYAPTPQYRRRSILARARNRLLAQALHEHAWVLWIDVDVAWWPPDVIEQLQAVQQPIVVPHCVLTQGGASLDWNSFKLAPEAAQIDWSAYLLDGLFQPPPRVGRLFLDQLRQYDLVELDSVGGTMLLIQADLHREGLIFPQFSYKHYIETEGLAQMAHDMGHRCWGLPNLEILHPAL